MLWPIKDCFAASLRLIGGIKFFHFKTSPAQLSEDNARSSIPVSKACSLFITTKRSDKSNAADFFVEKNIDGALVGGASLDADIFSDIIEIYSRHKEK